MRALNRQIGVLYFERLLSSKEKALVEAEAQTAPPAETRKDFLRDPYALDFFNLWAAAFSKAIWNANVQCGNRRNCRKNVKVAIHHEHPSDDTSYGVFSTV